jgi:Co/Zn/Cd efflux system component
MSAHCHDHACETGADTSPRYRHILWVALFINALMFFIEIGASVASGSSALLADAIDFFGDAANYGVSLAVLSMGLVWRARAALLKALSMGVFGIAVLVKVGWSIYQGGTPEALTMGAVGALALLANLSVAALLYAYREGDANMRSVWLCTRNDAIGNIAVMLAALGVLGTGTIWPDVAVATLMATLALSAAWTVLRQARGELQDAAHGHAH